MFGEDFTVYFADFGVDVTIDGVSARGIFDNAYSQIGGGVGMASTNPTLTVETTSVPAAPVGKTVACEGVTYGIAEHHPDGTGVSVLVLELAS
ncbi:head-tail joining protein [Noviherbaspirillum sp. Root189]|uniref:head-tail joining protein n=1 Tax=Noviherbaspirillum sp. Root189 TaxID=1736487 RepID=UPI00070EB480|nr:hypothetical protein [Noviherbaspirillum sp. Root189]KRB73445.1 hypothetical protein ASE07_06225 [Noviherbaspirillum sp. Root189]